MNLLKLTNIKSSNDLLLMTQKTNLAKEFSQLVWLDQEGLAGDLEGPSLVLLELESLSESLDLVLGLLKDLDKAGGSGLVIKGASFSSQGAKEVLALADQLGLALFKISDQADLGAFYDYISLFLKLEEREQAGQLSYQQEGWDYLLMDGADPEPILEYIKDHTGKQAWLVDPFENTLASTTRADLPFPRFEIKKALSRASSSSRIWTRLRLRDNSSIYRQLGVVQLDRIQAYPHYLFIGDIQDLDDSSLNQVLSQTSQSLARSLSKKELERYYQLINQQNLLEIMLRMAGQGKENDAEDLARNYGLSYNKSGRILILTLTNIQQKFSTFKREGYSLVYSYLDNYFSSQEGFVLYPLIDRNSYLIFSNNEDLNALARKANKVMVLLDDRLGLEFLASISPAYTKVKDMTAAYYQGLEAMSSGQALQSYPKIRMLKNQTADYLFSQIPAKSRENFIRSQLGPLYNRTDSASRDFSLTLETWLNSSYSISQTAEKLYIHRNTVSYRLNKCQEILKLDLDDPNILFNLQLAYRLMV